MVKKSKMEYTPKALSILDAAKKLFSKKGYKAVTTREIAKVAGVNEITIFRQFQSKEKLFEKMLAHIIFKPKMSEYIDETEKELNKYLLGIGNLIHTIFVQNIDLFQIELTESTFLKNRKILAKFPNNIKKKVVEYLITMQNFDEKSAEIYATNYMSAVHGLCLNIYFLDTFDPKPDFYICLDFLIKKFV